MQSAGGSSVKTGWMTRSSEGNRQAMGQGTEEVAVGVEVGTPPASCSIRGQSGPEWRQIHDYRKAVPLADYFA